MCYQKTHGVAARSAKQQPDFPEYLQQPGFLTLEAAYKRREAQHPPTKSPLQSSVLPNRTPSNDREVLVHPLATLASLYIVIMHCGKHSDAATSNGVTYYTLTAP